MITKDKTTEIFCMADDFCKFFDGMTEKYTLKPTGKRKYHRSSTMSKAEVMLIMILFHTSGYHCFKHFYLEKVCKHLRHDTVLKKCVRHYQLKGFLHLSHIADTFFGKPLKLCIVYVSPIHCQGGILGQVHLFE